VRIEPAVGFILLAIATCTPAPYRPDISLSDTYFESTDGMLRGRVPKGWFVPNDIELTPHLSAMLVSDDYAGAMTFQEIKLSAAANQGIESGGTALLAEVSIQLRQAADPNFRVTSTPTTFIFSQHLVGSRYDCISPSNGGQLVVTVFRLRGRIYEAVIFSMKQNSRETAQLAAIQREVLASLEP
jgi:hypothetical protein